MTAYTAELQKLYIAFFNRPADVEGLAFWEQARAGGASLESIADQFAGTPQYRARLASEGPARTVDAIYQNLLGRPADQGGRDFWAAALAEGRMNASDIALTILDIARNTDLAAIDNKATAAQAFTQALVTPEQIGAYANPAALSVAQAWLSAVSGDAATLNTATAGVAAAVTAAVDAALGRTTPGPAIPTAPAPAPAPTSLIVTTAPGAYTLDASADTSLASISVTNPAQGAGAITIKAPAAAMTLSTTATLAAGETAGAISVEGGSTVSVTQAAATSGALGTGAGQSAVTATGTASTTAVTVTQTAPVAAAATVAASTESVVVTWAGFNAGGFGYQIAGGLKVAGFGPHTQAEVALVAAGGTVAGLTLERPETALWTVGAAVGATTLFTSTTPNANVKDVAYTGSGYTYSPAVVTTQGVNAVAGAAGLAAGAVTITDVNAASLTEAGTIASISLANFGVATANSSALSALTLGGAGTSFALTSGALMVPVTTTLALTLNGLTTTGSVALGAVPTTVNITAAAAASTLAALTAAGATTVSITGDRAFTTAAQAFAADASISSTGTGAVTLGSTLLAGQSYSGGTGIDTIKLSASGTRAITTGDGNDNVTYGGPLGAGGTIDAGAGTDTILMTGAQAASAFSSSSFASKVSHFEVLALTGSWSSMSQPNLNMANAGGINTVQSDLSAGGVTVSQAAADFTLVQRGLNTGYGYNSIALANSAGTSDHVTLAFSGEDGFTQSAYYGISGVERLTITTADTDALAQTAAVAVQLSAGAATSVTLSGSMGVQLSGLNSSGLALLDASGLTGTGAFGGITFTSGALGTTANIMGSAAGTNTVDFTAASAAGAFVTYTGGSGTDIVTAGTRANVISTGGGNDVVRIGAAIAFGGIDVGTGNDTIELTGVQATADGRAPITGMGAGDVVNLAGAADGRTVSSQTSLGAMLVVGGSPALADCLDAATAGDGATANTALSWFQFNGNTYIVQDTSSAATFQNGHDSVVELVGLLDLSASAVASGIITL